MDPWIVNPRGLWRVDDAHEYNAYVRGISPTCIDCSEVAMSDHNPHKVSQFGYCWSPVGPITTIQGRRSDNCHTNL